MPGALAAERVPGRQGREGEWGAYDCQKDKTRGNAVVVFFSKQSNRDVG